jgi:hypothetical protein
LGAVDPKKKAVTEIQEQGYEPCSFCFNKLFADLPLVTNPKLLYKDGKVYIKWHLRGTLGLTL